MLAQWLTIAFVLAGAAFAVWTFYPTLARPARLDIKRIILLVTVWTALYGLYEFVTNQPPETLVATLNGVAPLATPVLLGWLAYQAMLANKNADRARIAATDTGHKTIEVAFQLESDRRTNAELLAQSVTATNRRLDTIMVTTLNTQRMGTATHQLVNSGYGAALLAALEARRLVVKLTTDPTELLEAQAALDDADRMYKEYLARQAQVDAGPSPEPTESGNPIT